MGEGKKIRLVVTTPETACISVILSTCRWKTYSRGGSHCSPTTCAHSHTLSFSSWCPSVEGGGQTGFRFSQPLGLLQAHPHSSQQQGLPPRCPTPLLAQALSGGKVPSATRQMRSWWVCVFLPKPTAVSPPRCLHIVPPCLSETISCHAFGWPWTACVCSPLTLFLFRESSRNLWLSNYIWACLLISSAQYPSQAEEPKVLISFSKASWKKSIQRKRGSYTHIFIVCMRLPSSFSSSPGHSGGQRRVCTTFCLPVQINMP